MSNFSEVPANGSCTGTHKESCLLLYQGGWHFSNAIATCEKNGMTLVSVTSATLQDYLKDMLR